MKACFLLLQMAGIGHVRRNIYRSSEAWTKLFAEIPLPPGESSRTVDMCVVHNYSIDVTRRNGSVFPVGAISSFFWALKKTAVNQHLHAGLVGMLLLLIDEVFRSGNGSSSAEELEDRRQCPFGSSLT